MSYKIEVDFTPVYELVCSFTMFIGKKFIRNLDLGNEWIQKVKKQLSAEYIAEIDKLKKSPCMEHVYILAWKSPFKSDVNAFITWLGTLSPGEMYEKLAPYVAEDLSSDLGDMRDQYVSLLFKWNEQYFQHIEVEILTELEKDAAEKELLIGTIDPVDLLEQVSGGIRVEPFDELEVVVLAPSYHFTPLTLRAEYKNMFFIQYSVDVGIKNPEDPPKNLMRMTRALADENRLRILKFLVDGPRTFNEILQFSSLAKSTVHHHLMALRGSGLISIYISQCCLVDQYRLRSSSFKELNVLLGSFLDIMDK